MIGKEAITVRDVASDLLHPVTTRTCRAASEMHASAFEVHDEQQIVSDQTTLGPYFDGGKVDRCQHIPMSFQEGFPGSLSLAVRCRFDPVGFQNVAYRSIGDLVANVG